MFKIDLILKIMLFIITIFITVITNNKIILWLLLMILSFYNLYKNKKLLLISIILTILLALSVDKENFLLIYKILFIINVVLTFYSTLTNEDKKYLFQKKETKLDFYENNFDRIVKNIEIKKSNMYDKDISIDNRIENDLERQYLQSKIRYYSVYSKRNNVWNIINMILLILIIILIILLFVLR